MAFIRYKKFGQQEYAYEVHSYWDSKKQKPRQRSKYLGIVVDKEKGIFKKPSERKASTKKEKFILDFGDSYILQKFIEDMGLEKILKDIFGKHHESVLALVIYRLISMSAMRQAKVWLEGSILSVLLKKANLNSQSISALFKAIGSDDIQKQFFKKFIDKFVEKKQGVIIDSTALPNQIDIPFTSWGYNDGSIDKQIKFFYVAEKETGMPIYYRCMPGNASDVRSLECTIEELSKLSVNSNFALLDAGFYSENNIKDLLKKKIDFMIRMPARYSIYEDLIKEEVPTLEKPCNATILGEKRVLFIKQKKIKLFENEVYASIVLDPERKGRETRDLILRKLGKDDEGTLEDKMLKQGVMILISSFKQKESEIVSTYYLRLSVERLFGFSKADLALLPLRVHNEKTLQGFLFITFIALNVFMRIKAKLPVKTSVEDLLLAMRNIKCKVFDDEILVHETTLKQEELAQHLNILMPKTLGI